LLNKILPLDGTDTSGLVLSKYKVKEGSTPHQQKHPITTLLLSLNKYYYYDAFRCLLLRRPRGTVTIKRVNPGGRESFFSRKEKVSVNWINFLLEYTGGKSPISCLHIRSRVRCHLSISAGGTLAIFYYLIYYFR